VSDGDADEELYGVLAEFDAPERLLEAARALRDAGYELLDAYTPYPVDGLPEALGLRPTRIAAVVLAGGVLGGSAGYFMQWYSSVTGFALNVGGRPHNSWPAFVPITFELTILGAAFAALFGMLIANRLTRLDHPLFAIERFELASSERFFLCVEARDSRFELAATRALLERFQPETLHDVEA
jgi:hypothetical protein